MTTTGGGFRRRALALALGTLAALVAVEVLARGAGYHGIADPAVFAHDGGIGWVLMPNRHEWHSALDFGVWVTTDRDGLRADEGRAASPGNGKRPTALLLGDSFAFGWGVRSDQTLAHLLDGELATTHTPFTVRNAGVPGYSTDQEYLLFRRLVGAVHPALVILLFHSSDFSGNTVASNVMGRNVYFKPRYDLVNGALRVTGVPVPDKRELVPSGAGEPIKRAFRPLATYAMGQLAVQRVRVNRAMAAAPAPGPPVVAADAVEITAALIAALQRDVRSAGADFMVALAPSDSAVSARLAEICRAQSISYLDLQSAFAGQHDVLLPFDRHWNAKGHRIAARALANEVRSEKLTSHFHLQ